MAAIGQEKARFDTRISKAQKTLFEKAARIAGFRNLSEFVITTVQQRASEIVEKQETILTSERDRSIFFDAITDPAKPNKALRDAARQYESKIER